MGKHPTIFYSKDPDEQERKVDDYIDNLKEAGLTDIVVLTCSTEERTIFSNVLSRDSDGTKWKQSNIPFCTCRKFKGLEADAVILVDVSSQIWAGNEDRSGLLFYTGASRAKQELRIVCDMGEDDFPDVLEAMGVRARRKPFAEFKKKVNAIVG